MKKLMVGNLFDVCKVCCLYREVVMDESQGIAYDALLSKVDVSQGSWGMYNFYRLQVFDSVVII